MRPLRHRHFFAQSSNVKSLGYLSSSLNHIQKIGSVESLTTGQSQESWPLPSNMSFLIIWRFSTNTRCRCPFKIILLWSDSPKNRFLASFGHLPFRITQYSVLPTLFLCRWTWRNVKIKKQRKWAIEELGREILFSKMAVPNADLLKNTLSW